MTYNLGKDTRRFIKFDELPGGRYYVNPEGFVVDCVKDKVVKDYDNGAGYRIIGLYLPEPKKTKIFYVHRLVSQYYIENPRGLKYVNHIDGDKSNNRVSNLEWVSASENTRHGVEMGTINRVGRSCRNFERKPISDLKESVKLYCSGKSIRECAEDIGSVRGTLSSLFNGRSRPLEMVKAFEEVSCGKCGCVRYLNNLRKITNKGE